MYVNHTYASAELQLKQWLITDAQGLTTQVESPTSSQGAKSPPIFTSKDGFQPFH